MKYFHKQATGTKNKARAARFLQPVHAVKQHKGDPNNLISITSFQSTGSTNILSVNAVNTCHLFCETKERGQIVRGTKRAWGVEMNESRKCYLATYGQIDNIDHYIILCCIFYVCWKWWHAPMNHGKAMTCAVAYAVYKE